MTYETFAICAGGCGEEYEKDVMAKDGKAFYCDTCQQARAFVQIKTQWQASRGTRLILEAEGLTIQSPIIDLTNERIAALWIRTLKDEYLRLKDSTPEHTHHHLVQLSETHYACPGGM